MSPRLEHPSLSIRRQFRAPTSVTPGHPESCMPGFHTRYTGMPGLNSYSMPGPTTRDTGHKALMPGVTSPHQQIAARLSAMLWAWGCSASVVGTRGKKSGNSACGFEPALSWRAPAARSL